MHSRYFQPSWFKQFSWLEYSHSKDAIFCLCCFLFNSNPSSHFGSIAFIHSGFSNWKKLALVATAREVVEVHQFFKDLSNIVNVAFASSKRLDKLQKSQAAEITHLLRDDGCDELLKNMISFCETWELEFLDMNAQYIVGRSRNKKEDVIKEHHYRLQELKSRFNEHVVELLTLTTALDPKEFFKLFDIDKICIPINNLVESGKSVMYPLVDRLIRLILTLLVSTAFSKCALSAMKIVKTRLRSKIEDDFLRKKFNVNKIIDDFNRIKDRRVQVK
uniref:TTF-type domain-containing protein n=1 Tax=Gossypium raimondii TaxID=29730 RepID=A0A0D2STL1_GOSRA|nr:hypothetical protein B456_010G155800 [Gossypium raimondii]